MTLVGKAERLFEVNTTFSYGVLRYFSSLSTELEPLVAQSRELARGIMMHANKRVNEIGFTRTRSHKLDVSAISNAYGELQQQTERLLEQHGSEQALQEDPQSMTILHELRNTIDKLETAGEQTTAIHTPEPIFTPQARENLIRIVYQQQIQVELSECVDRESLLTFFHFWTNLEMLQIPVSVITMIRRNLAGEVLDRFRAHYSKDPNIHLMLYILADPKNLTECAQTELNRVISNVFCASAGQRVLSLLALPEIRELTGVANQRQIMEQLLRFLWIRQSNRREPLASNMQTDFSFIQPIETVQTFFNQLFENDVFAMYCQEELPPALVQRAQHYADRIGIEPAEKQSWKIPELIDRLVASELELLEV